MDTRIPNSKSLDPQVRQAIDWVRRYADSLGGGGVTDHGALTGLGDDDHTQYAQKANNLSDLTNASTARTNLGLGALATKSTVATGDIDADAVTNAKLANMAVNTIKGRVTAGTGDPEDLTAAQALSVLATAGTTLSGYYVVANGQAKSSADLDTTTSAQDISGCTTGSLALTAGDIVVISGIFDVRIDVTTIAFVGTLDINGAEQALQAIYKSTDTADRATVAQTWYYTVPSTTNYTFKLRGRTATGGTGDAFVTAHTSITWLVLRSQSAVVAASTGTAGGSDTQVQYNSSGSLAGTSALTIVSSIPTFADEAAFTVQSAAPATPSAGAVRLGAADFAGMPMVWVKNSLGMRLPVGIQGGSTITAWTPGGSNVTVFGNAATLLGASTSIIGPSAPGNFGDAYLRWRMTSSAVAGSPCGTYTARTLVLPGSTQGFLWRARVIHQTLQSGGRAFYGFSTSPTSLGNYNPSTGTNHFGFGWSAAQTTMRFFNNDGAGASTETDLGANFPTNTNGLVFDLYIWQPPGSSTVYYAIENRSTGVVASGSVSSDLPTGAVTVHIMNTNGTSAAAQVLDIASMTLETLL